MRPDDPVCEGDDELHAAVPVNVADDDVLHVGGDALGVDGSDLRPISSQYHIPPPIRAQYHLPVHGVRVRVAVQVEDVQPAASADGNQDAVATNQRSVFMIMTNQRQVFTEWTNQRSVLPVSAAEQVPRPQRSHEAQLVASPPHNATTCTYREGVLGGTEVANDIVYYLLFSSILRENAV